MKIVLCALFAAVVEICANEHERFARATLTSAYCRRNPDTCLLTFCGRLEYLRTCSNIHTKAQMRTRLTSCREPELEDCLKNLPIPADPVFTNTEASLTSANCRKDPENCVNILCQSAKYSSICSDYYAKGRMRSNLAGCREPSPEDCLKDLQPIAVNRNPVLSNNGIYCAAQMSYCSQLACNKLARSRRETCSNPDVKRRLENHLNGCKVFDLDMCVNNFIGSNSNNVIVFHNPLSAYSTADFNRCSMDNMGICIPGIDSSSSNWQEISKFCRENADHCLPVVCNIFDSLFGMGCNDYNVKNTIRRRLTVCYATVLGCITVLPINIRSLNALSCKLNPANCIATACAANKEGLSRGCEDWYVQREIEHKLKTCNNYFQCFRDKVMPLKSCNGWCPDGYRCKLSRCFPIVRKEPTRCYNSDDCAHSSIYSCSGGHQCRLIG